MAEVIVSEIVKLNGFMKRTPLFGLIYFWVVSCSHLGHPNENRANKFPEFSRDSYAKSFPGRELNIDYEVGDLFRLKQDMVLILLSSNVVNLSTIVGAGMHESDKRLSDENKHRSGIIKFIQKGTLIEIVAIKDLTGASAIPYFVIREDSDWFRCAEFKVIEASKASSGKKQSIIITTI